MSYDVVFENARIIDGTGSPWYRGKVAVDDGQLEAIGRVDDDAEIVVDVEGSVIAPGFIDIHTHSDFTLPANRNAHSKVRQGVTLEIVGNCGTSAAPRYGSADRAIDDWFAKNGLAEEVDASEWESVADYFDFLERDGLSLSVGTLVGHGNIRAAVIGYEDRTPTATELEEMQTLVSEAMENGAVGLSTGLFYPPGCYAETDEVVALAEVAAEYGGIYATHMRSESDDLIGSVEETLEIGRRADIPVQISHHKAIGPKNWGKVRYTLRRMELARERDGVEVQCDQYPYIASSTSLGVLLPNWAHDGGDDALIQRLLDEEERARIRENLATDRTSDWDGILVTNVQNPALQEYQGKTIADIADHDDDDRPPAEILLDIVLEDKNQTMHVNFGMDEDDIEYVMSHDLTMVGSDGSSLCPCGPLGEGVPHPRNYGTFPHVLGKYVREKEVIPLEEAVHKMTGMPAARLGIDDRGILKRGARADLTIFDSEAIHQPGDFLDPAKYPDGIEHVLVNGEFVVRDGDHTGARPGEVIRQ
ncbi:N-acyl-D-amino-acid deacylase [Haladaptatus litoreus]|uniref:N-acyl-D-amino-acid deacylase n=1 Tax=Haladaptatus litoreus TaxID=553468 RepID=A0A1N7CR76_9EURY|nr:D-aminoacylase [Haladaptatus litoreus]SIR65997.1 N-acyl-D-amino-acid deacylase [Haladaptatus litoreus]